MKKKLLIGIGVMLVIIQFFKIDKTNPDYLPENDFIQASTPPKDVRQVLKQACYDCHSNETNYPWYTNIAPVSWWIKHHINEGRDELNFSEWASYTQKRKDHKLKEVIEMVEEGEMPLKSYTWGHPEAKLSEEQKQSLIDWVRTIQ